MTARTEMFPHVGGPVDGESFAVEVDEAGAPAEFHTIDDFDSPDPTINPAFGIQTKSIVHLYERDVRPEGDLCWVFRFRGSEYIDHNEAA